MEKYIGRQGIESECWKTEVMVSGTKGEIILSKIDP